MGFLSDIGRSLGFGKQPAAKAAPRGKETLSPEQQRHREGLGRILDQAIAGGGVESPLFVAGRDVISRTAQTQRKRAKGDPSLPVGLLGGQMGDIDRGQLQAVSSLLSQSQQQLIAQIMQYIGLGTPRTGSYVQPGTEGMLSNLFPAFGTAFGGTAGKLGAEAGAAGLGKMMGGGGGGGAAFLAAGG